MGFCWRGGERGGDGGAFSLGIFLLKIGIALHVISFSSFLIEGDGGEGVGTTSGSEVGAEY